jgi:hypothetical protein
MTPQNNTAAASTSPQTYRPEIDDGKPVIYNMYSGNYSLSIGGRKLKDIEDRTKAFNPKKRQWKGREGDFNVFRVDGWNYDKTEENPPQAIPVSMGQILKTGIQCLGRVIYGTKPTSEFRPCISGDMADEIAGTLGGCGGADYISEAEDYLMEVQDETLRQRGKGGMGGNRNHLDEAI